MARNKKSAYKPGDLVALQQSNEVVVLPPNSGVIGRFLEETANMFKARGMRMGGLLRRINESGQRTEVLLRMAAERTESAEVKLNEDLKKEGLAPEFDQSGDRDDAE